MLKRIDNFKTSKPYAKAICMKQEYSNEHLSQLLVDVALKRDQKAFTIVFQHFAPKIKRFAVQKFSNSDKANDIVQDTMSNVWRKAHLFCPNKGAAHTWIYTIMRNVTFDALRKIRSGREDNLSEDIWSYIEGETEEKVFEDHLEKKFILANINKLSEAQLSVVKAFYFSELSQEQISECLDIPLGTVKSRLRLAVAKLKGNIGDDL
ncbi:RNA polymerase subunit sigma [Shewanella sp. OPT22]|nr:RNA polymerase subunit sigma [Shewanella sp. OPT22]